ncbi:hypothetical protein [Actinoplanes sp. NPDC051494]|uniref:hypothetical protein n=1 Tax=Actinoplanes sp. NPDC051494 TaxID=3363907 RepID=UPI00379F99B8
MLHPLIETSTVPETDKELRRVELELIFPVLNAEDGVRALLEEAAEGLSTLDRPGALAVVDRGSSDRTIEVVDDFAGESPIPVRVLGCSAPGWGAGALRGVRTSPAGWVGVGEPGAFTTGLAHAVRLLAGGQHIVCLGAEGSRVTLLHRSVAELVFGDEPPPDAGFTPRLRDTAGHSGIRMTAHGSSRVVA